MTATPSLWGCRPQCFGGQVEYIGVDLHYKPRLGPARYNTDPFSYCTGIPWLCWHVHSHPGGSCHRHSQASASGAGHATLWRC